MLDFFDIGSLHKKSKLTTNRGDVALLRDTHRSFIICKKCSQIVANAIQRKLRTGHKK